MLARSPLLALGLAIASCAGPSAAPRWPLRSVVVEPSEGPAMRLVHDGGRFLPRDLAPSGGAVSVPAGAWRLEFAGEVPDRPWVAVPAFADPCGGGTDLRQPPLRVPTGRAPAGDDEFATIPAGPAWIGDRLGVGQPDERPARLVDLPAFQLGRREVTNARYVEFLNARAGSLELDTLLDLRNRKCRIERLDDGSFTTDAPDLPVVTVSWEGAAAYCRWRGELDPAHRYRLPTEVEWEKAARGPGSWVYSYGNVYTPDAANQESGALRPAATFPPSPWGLYDLTGNAFEWTSSEDPATGRRHLRGGSFVLDGIFLRNSFRMLLRPTVRADDVGFRVLRVVPASQEPTP